MIPARTMTPEDFLLGMENSELPFMETLGGQLASGVHGSFGLGTTLRSAETPPLATTYTPGYGKAPSVHFLTPEEAFARGDQLLSPDEFKTSPNFRQEVPWEKGMTVARQQALAEQIDLEKTRTYWGSKRPATAFFGRFFGQAVDPINYIPIFGEVAMPAMLGKVLGGAARGALEASTNVGLASVLTAPERAKLGDDISWTEMLHQMAYAAMIGGAVGGFHGYFTKEGESTLPPAPMMDKTKAAIIVNDAIDSQMAKDSIELGPNSQQLINDAITAYHGSPYAFDAFSSERIGTGEGAQSFSHGLYFSKARAVGERYFQDVNERASPELEKALKDANYLGRGSSKEVLNARRAGLFKDVAAEVPSLAPAKAAEIQKGLDALGQTKSLYKVAINAPERHFIDFDKPLAEQSEYVKDALKVLADKIPKSSLFKGSVQSFQNSVVKRFLLGETVGTTDHSMGTALRMMEDVLGGPEKTSKFLNEGGIPGVKYLDQLSRKPERNIPDNVRKAFEALGRLGFGTVEQAVKEMEDLGANWTNLWVIDTPQEKAAAKIIEEFRQKPPELKPGTHNFVVFNDKLVHILERNDKPLNFAKNPANEPAPEAVAAADAAQARVTAKPTINLDEILAKQEKLAKGEGIDLETGKHDLEDKIKQMRDQGLIEPGSEADQLLVAEDENFKSATTFSQMMEIGSRCIDNG